MNSQTSPRRVWLTLFGAYRFIGVADMASVRFSLPAQLLEPVPNLGLFSDSCQCSPAFVLMDGTEYWNYLDRPETFAAYVLHECEAF